MTDTRPDPAERIKTLETALVGLRERLDKLTANLRSTPNDTSLVIQRVNVMKLIFQAQTEIDRLRASTGFIAPRRD